VAPLLPPVAVDLDAYVTSLQRRFASPAVSDPLARLCRNGSSKVPAHVLSSIREARALGRPHPRLTLAVAAWFEHLLHGRLEDPEGPRLRALARRGVHALVADERTFGPLSRGGAFAAELAATVRRLEVHGMRAPARGMEVT
jgi:fructuronate reductase/mannitol 2-dehydrogenase